MNSHAALLFACREVALALGRWNFRSPGNLNAQQDHEDSGFSCVLLVVVTDRDGEIALHVAPDRMNMIGGITC